MLDAPQYNNVYQYESGIAKFGYQKFYNVYPTKSGAENANYYLLLSSQIKQRTVLKCNLDSCENLLILREILDTVRHQVEFKFDRIVLGNFDNLKANFFFHQHEQFLGQSMVSVHMNDLGAISRALQTPDIMKSDSTLMAECIDCNRERLAKYARDGIVRDSLRIINNDFNLNCEVQKALRLGEGLAQKLLLEKALEANTTDYQHLFMQILAEILKKPSDQSETNQNVEYLLPFFRR